jgi:hypothetical protein
MWVYIAAYNVCYENLTGLRTKCVYLYDCVYSMDCITLVCLAETRLMGSVLVMTCFLLIRGVSCCRDDVVVTLRLVEVFLFF